MQFQTKFKGDVMFVKSSRKVLTLADMVLAFLYQGEFIQGGGSRTKKFTCTYFVYCFQR